MNTISVVIPTYHRYDALEATYADLLAQSRPPDQIIVIDNTSLEERHRPSYLSSTPTTECIYISSSREGRVNVARNEGLEKVTSTFALYFDDDMSIPIDCIETFLSVHDEGWDAVTGSIVEGGRILEASEIAPNRPLWSVLRTQHGNTRGTTIGVPSCLISVRTSALKEVGGFDEAYIYNYDDYDIGIRLWKAGFLVVREPRISVNHLKVPTGGGRVNSPVKRKLNKFTAKYYFLSKHFNERATKIEFLTDILLTVADTKRRPRQLLNELWMLRKAFGAYSTYGSSEPCSFGSRTSFTKMQTDDLTSS